MSAGQKCPRCDSPKPSLHPAMQFEGEVQICPHPWHGSEYGSTTFARGDASGTLPELPVDMPADHYRALAELYDRLTALWAAATKTHRAVSLIGPDRRALERELAASRETLNAGHVGHAVRRARANTGAR